MGYRRIEDLDICRWGVGGVHSLCGCKGRSSLCFGYKGESIDARGKTCQKLIWREKLLEDQVLARDTAWKAS